MSDDNRDELLAAARDILAKRGYVGLTMRTASAAAGITPDMARRYYRNRDALFAAALKLPVDPTSAIPTLLAPGIEGMGERLVRFTFDVLRDPQAREELLSLARTGVTAGHAAAGLQDFIEHGVIDRLAGLIGVPDARMRAALVSSYLLGVAMSRYALRIEPLASASEEEVIRMVAPVIQDLLDPRKPLPGSDRSRARHDRDAAPVGEAATWSSSGPTGPQRSASSRAEAAGAERAPAGAEPAAPRRTRTFDPDPAATAARLAAQAAAAAAAGSTSEWAEPEGPDSGPPPA